uniref:Uncharacterized protein n=2 Tax=Avena sativa TaxID=4498 RepID=A0ACD5TGA0_AVESA
MSALLRQGLARRLGGSMVQRAQAAVAEERRRFGPRLMHTDESVRKELMLEIQQKKEELYDVISMAEKEHRIINWCNRKLLHNLSAQVTPRPYDSKWCRTRNAKRMNGAIVTAGRVSLSSALAYAVFLLWPLAEKEKPVLTSKGSGDNI